MRKILILSLLLCSCATYEDDDVVGDIVLDSPQVVYKDKHGPCVTYEDCK